MEKEHMSYYTRYYWEWLNSTNIWSVLYTSALYEWAYENMQLTLTDLLGATGKIPGGKVHMMFVILCNFKGGVNFDYSILVYYMFHMLYYTILCCTVYSILVYYTFTQIIISTSPCNLTFTLCVLYTKHIFLLSLYRFKLRFCSLLLRFAWWLHNIRLTTYEMQIGIRKFGWSLLFSNLLDGFTRIRRLSCRTLLWRRTVSSSLVHFNNIRQKVMCP